MADLALTLSDAHLSAAANPPVIQPTHVPLFAGSDQVVAVAMAPEKPVVYVQVKVARARQIDDTSIVDTTSFEVKDIDTPPKALPGGAWITDDGVQPDFKADAESLRARPEKKT